MKLKNKVAFITGANRGIGKALVESGLKYGFSKIYAAARNVKEIPNFNDPRVVPVELDITDRSQIDKAAELAGDTQLLINNAGSLAHASILEGEVEMIRRDMEVNYIGTLQVTRAFVPVILAQGGGAVASVSSVVGLASIAGVGGYSASKAALFSAIQSMRSELKTKPIQVFGIYPGPIDTDMARSFDFEKATPGATADRILQSIEDDKEDIFPDPMSEQVGELWKSDPKALERQFSEM